MSPPPDFAALIAEKDGLIAAQAETIALLMERIAELEARLGLPPKTPDNSSVPPSQGRKASEGSGPKAKGKPRIGALIARCIPNRRRGAIFWLTPARLAARTSARRRKVLAKLTTTSRSPPSGPR